MRAFFKLIVAFSLLAGCGVNTDSPVYPISSLLAIGAPTLVNLEPVASTDPDVAPYFKVSYFVTNQEDEFIGYNLYVSKVLLSSEAIITGTAGSPYLPDGLDPTFRHTKDEASTLSTDLKTETISYFKPPPSPESFQYCRVYYFALRAVLLNGQYSQPGPQLSACITDANFCPTTNDCN
jgi:hypothetical protein